MAGAQELKLKFTSKNKKKIQSDLCDFIGGMAVSSRCAGLRISETADLQLRFSHTAVSAENSHDLMHCTDVM